MTKYQHYKGDIYTFIAAATHTETHQTLAIYQNDEGIVFARPYDMFFEKVEVDGEMVERFKEIKSKEIMPRVSMKSGKPSLPTPSQKKFRDMIDNPEPKENYMSNLLKKYGRNK